MLQFVEVPEIEKEVKRLLRMDNEAVQVRHEVVDEEKKQLKDESGLPTVASIKEELGTHVRSLHMTHNVPVMTKAYVETLGVYVIIRTGM